MTAAPSHDPQAREYSQQYSLGHLTIIDTPTPELVRIAARAGYDFVSPRLICDGLPGMDHSLARNPALLRATQAALAALFWPALLVIFAIWMIGDGITGLVRMLRK